MSTTASIRERTTDSAKALRRWGSKTHASSSKMSTPLRERTNTTTLAPDTPATGSTTFLPEMHSTPPMPTFQKPSMGTPAPLERSEDTGNAEPSLPHRDMSRRPWPMAGAASTCAAHRENFSRGRAVHTTTPLTDRLPDTPALPSHWGPQHDRAICILDARNYNHAAIVLKVRRAFPELHGMLTPAMVDKRLRQLDQNVYIDYWAVGLAKSDKQQTEQSVGQHVLGERKLDGSTGSIREAGRAVSADRARSRVGGMEESVAYLWLT